MEVLLVVLGAVALFVAGAIWRGYVLSVLWGWFIVPTFGLPALSITLAIGVALVAGFLAHQYVYTKDDRTAGEKFGHAVGAVVLYPALVLLMGWIVTLFL